MGTAGQVVCSEIRLKSLKSLVLAIEPHTLAEHLKRRRRELCIRQVDAAKLIGVDEETYWHWEKGRAEPRASSWAGVVRFLGYESLPAAHDPWRAAKGQTPGAGAKPTGPCRASWVGSGGYPPIRARRV